mgnify:CR=1 FL=1
MKTKILLLTFFASLLFIGCTSVTRMTSSNMNKLELGMTKEEVTNILGKEYTIAEKRIENGVEIEVISYRDFYRSDEFYLFVFSNNKLQKWYRELMPRYSTVND